MKRAAKYIGLDVHPSSTVASVRTEHGRVIARALLPTEEEALVAFFGGLGTTVHVAFEEGTQAQWLHELLTPSQALLGHTHLLFKARVGNGSHHQLALSQGIEGTAHITNLIIGVGEISRESAINQILFNLWIAFQQK